jgi:transcription elongation factor GreA
MAEKQFLTQEGFKKLKDELKHLRELSRTTVAAKMKDARDMGNVLENVVFDAAVEEQNLIDGKIQEIEEVLNNAQIVSKEDIKDDVVMIGSKVVVESEGKRDTFTIVGSAEADPTKRYISNESPVGKALLGAKLGSQVKVETPIFKVVYKVVEISYE